MYEAILDEYLSGDQTALVALHDFALDEGMDDQTEMWAIVIQGRERIDALTPAEEKFLSVITQHWIGIGHQTGPTNRELCERLIDDVYWVTGLKPPKEKKWKRSPLELVQECDKEWDRMRNAVWAKVRNKVRNAVWDREWDRMRNAVWDKIWNKVRDEVRNAVWDRACHKVRNAVWGRVCHKVQHAVWDRVYCGTHDAHWVSFHHAFALLGLQGGKDILPLVRISQHCGWWTPGEDIVLLSDLPVSFTNTRITYRDGFSVEI